MLKDLPPELFLLIGAILGSLLGVYIVCFTNFIPWLYKILSK